jgi:hypothetical protein
MLGSASLQELSTLPPKCHKSICGEIEFGQFCELLRGMNAHEGPHNDN